MPSAGCLPVIGGQLKRTDRLANMSRKKHRGTVRHKQKIGPSVAIHATTATGSRKEESE